MNKSALITGLGGQGVILFGNIFADFAHSIGHNVKQLQTINLAMRMGPVQTTVRFGEQVYSPMAYKKSCDYIIAFEKLEALRSIDYLKDDGVVLVNDLSIKPMSVVLDMEKYPQDIIEALNDRTKAVHVINANEIAFNIGNEKTVNIIMLGAFSKLLGYDGLLEFVKTRVPKKYIDLNIAAFKAGREQIN